MTSSPPFPRKYCTLRTSGNARSDISLPRLGVNLPRCLWLNKTRAIGTIQVLALWGEADPWTPLNTGTHSGVSLGQHLETFELVVLPETGHCPHDESPEECHEGTRRSFVVWCSSYSYEIARTSRQGLGFIVDW